VQGLIGAWAVPISDETAPRRYGAAPLSSRVRGAFADASPDPGVFLCAGADTSLPRHRGLLTAF
jgi:hypothetical protein